MSQETADFVSERIKGYLKHGGNFFTVPLFSQINEFLWMGGAPRHGSDSHWRFDYIIDLYCNQHYEARPGQIVVKCPLLDIDKMPDVELMTKLAALTDHFASKGPTLVHCQAGLNRSGLIVALTLIKHLGYKSQHAIETLRANRCQEVLVNGAFRAWIMDQKSGR